MAKATKSRKSGKGARKTSSKAKPHKAANARMKKAIKASARKPAAAAKNKKAARSANAKKPALAAQTQTIKAGAATAVFAKAERAAPRGVPAPVEQQPPESETPPALPVPIASFTF